MGSSSSLRIVRGFRRAGFCLDPDAVQQVAEFAEKYDEDVPSLVEEIVAGLATSQSTTIHRADLDPILEEFLKRGLLTEDADPLSLDTTPDRIVDDNGAAYHASPEAKWSRYQRRYELLHWRLKRTGIPGRREAICEIKALRETSHSVALFGLLREADGAYALEEPGGCITLALESCKNKVQRMIAESEFVVVTGRLVSDVFRVEYLNLPVAEPRSDTLLNLGQSPFASSFAELLGMTRITEISAYQLVIFRDVFFDLPDVVLRFERALCDLEARGAFGAIILVCGEFHSRPRTASPHEYAVLFQALADLIGMHELLARQNRFVFIGGDFGFGSRSLPRFGPPSDLVERFRSRVRNADFPSNPARIWHGPDEIVIFRHELAAQMKTASVFRRTIDDELADLVTTVLDEGHLVPVPDAIQPVYWARDRALHLFPLPTILILADDILGPFDDSYQDCRILNPDNFSRTKQYGIYSSLDNVFTIMQAR